MFYLPEQAGPLATYFGTLPKYKNTFSKWLTDVKLYQVIQND